MIWRSFDPGEVNAIINRDDVRPYVGGIGYLDTAEVMANPLNICLMSEAGGSFFRHLGDRVYEGHSFFVSRGKAAIDTGRKMIGAMFDEYGAKEITGETPLYLKHARLFNRLVGMQSCGIQLPHSVEVFSIRKGD